jgi:hypothetical protein
MGDVKRSPDVRKGSVSDPHPRKHEPPEDVHESGDRIVIRGGERHAPHQLGDLCPTIVCDHGGEREVIAEEQFVFLTGAAAFAVPPRRLFVGIGAVFLGAPRGEILDVGPVDRERDGAGRVLPPDTGLEEGVEDLLERLFGCAVGNVFAQHLFDEGEGVLDLTVGQGVRAVLRLADDAEITAVLVVESHKCPVHP